MNKIPECIIAGVLAVMVCLAGAIVRSAPIEPLKAASAPTTRLTTVQDAETKQSYVGSEACFTCHRQQGASWTDTKHAQSFEHLPEKYRTDSSCLACHVTAFGEPSGYVADMAAEDAKPFLNVGCESCHGPGAEHVAGVQRWMTAAPADEEKLLKEMRVAVVKTPTDSQCAVCHQNQSHQTHPAYDGQPVRSSLFHGSSQKTTSAAAGSASLADNYSVKTCGSCHYEQYKTWLLDKHVDLSTGLSAKYADDESCLKCHRKSEKPSDWFAGKTDLQGDANPLGVGCESCHGSAAKHVLFNKQFIQGPQLTPETREASRELMRKAKLASACLQCHVREGHQEHPKYQKPDAAKTGAAKTGAANSK